MDEAGTWRLAPAYDLTYSAGPGGEHYLDIEGEGRNPTRNHVLALGRRHGLAPRHIEAVIEEVAAAVALWPRFAAEVGVGRASLRDIGAALADVGGRFSG
jgi:serine/threonine-protein kinase HipA